MCTLTKIKRHHLGLVHKSFVYNGLNTPWKSLLKICISCLDKRYQLIPAYTNHDKGRLLLCLFNRYPPPG